MTGARIVTGLLSTLTAAAVLACGSAASSPQTDATSAPVGETLTPLFSQALPNVPGKTFTSAVVTFPPAARAVPHRHGDAFVYAYVLEGAVSSQLEGTPAQVYHQGQSWSEPPGAHHVATENISRSDEAKLLVVFVATDGEQLKVDDPQP
ncbi:cupin domain-containing protein [Mycolicibacterium litorale]|uniref:Cupin n=1 Tax=Mycolicibacterium litorale TaxID=758802 RepID=A0AAD1ILL3_9MYCO|nr:cupin domain-containing protein [Mycolicibacterium litorale]MCV7416910.1 cupin domain-containing protein [Mycolicibacterium litorale]TDY04694.1 quercetin dioxygenase-like cupin family protein [Mycolicibacterium litorale]BBY18122.1 cupin [Mycolicibacterium litorale]